MELTSERDEGRLTNMYIEEQYLTKLMVLGFVSCSLYLCWYCDYALGQRQPNRISVYMIIIGLYNIFL